MILFYFLLNLSMAGGNQDHLVGPVLCFTLRDQSYISKVPDPQKVFNRTEWISVLAEPNPIRFGKSSKMNSSSRVTTSRSPASPTPLTYDMPTLLWNMHKPWAACSVSIQSMSLHEARFHFAAFPEPNGIRFGQNRIPFGSAECLTLSVLCIQTMLSALELVRYLY